MDTTVPKYLLVEDHIKTAIKERKLIDRLPGERALAKELGFSYMTIRKAIDNLVQEGVLYRIPTKGTYVVDRRKTKRVKTLTIGYFLDSSISAGISSPYYSMIFHALEREASRQGYSLTYFSDGGEDNLQKSLKKLDGVIATCFPRIENVIEDIAEEVPLVVMDNSAADKSIPSIIIDNYTAEIEAVNYLHSLGHKKIAFVCGLNNSDIGPNRLSGFKRGLKNNGLEFDESLVFEGDYSFESGHEAGAFYMSKKSLPTAIICASDTMAMGVIGSLHNKGFSVPNDVSVMGFDDIILASKLSPALTTLAAPTTEMAEKAFCMLKRLIDGDEVETQHVAMTAELKVRETTGECRKHSAAAA